MAAVGSREAILAHLRDNRRDSRLTHKGRYYSGRRWIRSFLAPSITLPTWIGRYLTRGSIPDWPTISKPLILNG